MFTKLSVDGVCRLALFHAIKNFLANEIYHFSRLSHQTTFLLGQPAPYNQLLIQPLNRSWDYPEHFRIYSQLDRKNKAWFFIFLNVYVSWIKQDKILISQLLPPKFRYFADQNRSKVDPMKMNFDNFQMQKWGSETGFEIQMKKMGSLVLFSYLPLYLCFFANITKLSKTVIAIYVYISESSCFALLENGVGYYAMI